MPINGPGRRWRTPTFLERTRTLAWTSVLSPEAAPSTSRLPGQARTPRTHAYSGVLNATWSRHRTDTADVAVQQTPRSSDFLNRVHWFDSGRGHSRFACKKRPVCRNSFSRPTRCITLLTCSTFLSLQQVKSLVPAGFVLQHPLSGRVPLIRPNTVRDYPPADLRRLTK
jgi:hypothetical protein